MTVGPAPSHVRKTLLRTRFASAQRAVGFTRSKRICAAVPSAMGSTSSSKWSSWSSSTSLIVSSSMKSRCRASAAASSSSMAFSVQSGPLLCGCCSCRCDSSSSSSSSSKTSERISTTSWLTNSDGIWDQELLPNAFSILSRAPRARAPEFLLVR